MRLSSGKLARMADGSCVAQAGGTSVLATAVCKKKASAGSSFMPLTVDYRQKAAAAGRIPTNFLRRELGSTEREILISRMIDRSIRPLFPSGFFCETQVLCSMLAVDGNNDPDILSINAASAALATSDIPWRGPIAAVRVGLFGDDNSVLINPTRKEMSSSKLDLVVAGSEDKHVVMMEGSASQPVTLNYVLKALKAALKEIRAIIGGIAKLQKLSRTVKREVELVLASPDHVAAVTKSSQDLLIGILTTHGHSKQSRDEAIQVVKQAAAEDFSTLFPNDEQLFEHSFTRVLKEAYVTSVKRTSSRCDGRSVNEVRPIACEVGLFEPLHGSALFQRGLTQVLCTVALDSVSSALKSDPVSVITGGLKEKNFMLHYEFPPFATNEVGRTASFNRRELGHGALAEKSLRPLIPDKFPFTIRLTCDVLESNGSSSMASVCAGSMALMDAGVPIAEAAAGVAMGLFQLPDDSHLLLTDIVGIEDYLGEMDFKLAGTRAGFTGLQLDVKGERGVPHVVVMDALQKGHEAKQSILSVMNQTICESRSDKETWPVSRKMTVPAGHMGRFLGPGAVNLKRVTAETGAQLTQDVEDANSFLVFAPNKEAMNEAEEMMSRFLAAKEPPPEFDFGAVVEATVVEVRDHGVMVSLHQDMEPVLLHLKELDKRKVAHPSALDLDVGQKILVKYFGRDPVSGHLRLSRRVLQMATPRTVKATT